MIKMIIKFYDNEKIDYPLLWIEDDDKQRVKDLLREYQKDEEYNFDDFLCKLELNNIDFKTFTYDEEWFF
jgi:tRNA 2-selenouridine synthase SelU